MVSLTLGWVSIFSKPTIASGKSYQGFILDEFTINPIEQTSQSYSFSAVSQISEMIRNLTPTQEYINLYIDLRGGADGLFNKPSVFKSSLAPSPFPSGPLGGGPKPLAGVPRPFVPGSSAIMTAPTISASRAGLPGSRNFGYNLARNAYPGAGGHGGPGGNPGFDFEDKMPWKNKTVIKNTCKGEITSNHPLYNKSKKKKTPEEWRNSPHPEDVKINLLKDKELVIHFWQAEHKFQKHSRVYGKYDSDLLQENVIEFANRVKKHVESPTTKMYEGTFSKTLENPQGIPALFFLDVQNNRLCAIFNRETGNFISTWLLNLNQAKSVINRGILSDNLPKT